LIDRYPSYEQGALAAEALPRLAGLFFDRSMKLIKNGKAEEGINGLRWMADRFPKTDFARRALLELGKYRESAGDYEGALRDYRRLAELYPGTEEAKAAAQRVAIVQKELGRPEAKATTPLTQTQSQPKEAPIPEKPAAAMPESAEGLLGGRRTFLALGSKLLGLEAGMSLKVISPTADLREGAGTEYRVIAKVGKGEALTLLDKSGRWYKVRTASAGEGWIWSGSVSESRFRVVLSLVNVRRSAGTRYDVITRVKKDTLLTKLDEVEGWYKVRLPDGSEGWIWGETLMLSETN
jgi:SH3-like domain-containing protein